MPYKRKEDKATQMRSYRKRKKDEVVKKDFLLVKYSEHFTEDEMKGISEAFSKIVSTKTGKLHPEKVKTK
jgi:hypothetical protein